MSTASTDKISSSVQKLDRSILLKETGAPQYMQWTIICCSAIVLLFLIWASSIRVDEVAKSTGEVGTSMPVHPIQHFYGGEINRIWVKDGDEVKEGQVLMELNDLEWTSQMDETKVQLDSAQGRHNRLLDFLEQDVLHVQDLPEDIVQQQNSLLKQLFISLEASREVSVLQVAQLKEEISTMKVDRDAFVQQLKMLEHELSIHVDTGPKTSDLIAQEKEALEEEMEIREELVDQGLNSNIKFLALQRQYFQIEKDILERKLAHDEKASMLKRQISQLTSQHDMIPHEITRKQVRISEIRKNLKLQESKAREQALFELDTVTETVKTLRERYLRFKERFDSSTLKATIDGTIQSLKRAGSGAVITPGELLCNIVPKEAKVIGLIKIDNKDIGHVSEGQDVRLKLTSFDFSRYGSLPGTITSIDANSTLEPTDGTTYFWARVDITSAKPNEDRPPLPLINGMSLDADIITGNKTVMEYLLKPIYASTLEAMQER